MDMERVVVTEMGVMAAAVGVVGGVGVRVFVLGPGLDVGRPGNVEPAQAGDLRGLVEQPQPIEQPLRLRPVEGEKRALKEFVEQLDLAQRFLR